MPDPTDARPGAPSDPPHDPLHDAPGHRVPPPAAPPPVTERPVGLPTAREPAAEELGTVREVLVRALRRFRAAGLVRTPARGRYVVGDRTVLARLAAE